MPCYTFDMEKPLRLVLVVSILASFVAFLDSSVVNVALPAITKSLGGGLVVQQWVVDAYLLTLGSLILIAGSLSDLFGRKKVLVFGLIGFLIASVLCGIAPNATFLIIARGLQGIAGALLVPSSLALIISAFKGEAQGKAIGTWTAWTGISFVVGPLLGGFLVDAASWRWIFLINIIPIAITLWLITLMRIEEALPENAHVDILGAFACAIGLGGMVYAFIEEPGRSWASPFVFIPLLIGAIAFIFFFVFEKKTTHPMLSLALFKVQNFSYGNIATVAIYAGLSVATFTLTLFLQLAGGFSALSAGLSLIPITLIMFVLSPRFGSLAGKYGPRIFMATGPIVAACGFLLFLSVHEPIGYWTQLFPGIMLFGFGLAMTVAPLTAAVLSDVPSGHAGMASAINNAVSRIAGLIAIALIGLVIGTNPFSVNALGASISAFHKATLAMAALLFIGGIVSALGIRNRKDIKTS
jgi:EmrB/QacA subfamily drug resistance transporter